MSERSSQGGDASDARRRRLAEALRVNLKLRKAQQRERSAVASGATARPAEDTRGDGG